MCGIAGIIKLNNKPLPAEGHSVTNLLLSLQSRGTDATGLAYLDMTDRCWRVYKACVPADEFIDIPEAQAFIKAAESKGRIILAHCRWASKGRSDNLLNAHPVYNADGLLIHNGTIQSGLPEREADGETDSEQLLLDIQATSIRDTMSRIHGGATYAYVDLHDPTVVNLVKYHNPISIVQNQNRLYFASTLEIMYALMPFTGKLSTMTDGEILTIDSATGTISMGKFQRDYSYLKETKSEVK